MAEWSGEYISPYAEHGKEIMREMGINPETWEY